MPFYRNIRRDNPSQAATERTLDRLLALREHLDRDVPPRTLDETILLATWNIREFDSSAYGDRMPEAFYYIAEIIARFDLVAVQEVRKDLAALDRLMNILGSHWDYIVTDVTEGGLGNKERLAFLYDSRKVSFGGLASELVIPPERVEIEGKDGKKTRVYQPMDQLARTPFVCGFKAGWTKFMLATVHVIYGKGGANSPERVQEIKQIAQFLRGRTLDQTAWAQNLILLGDFNIFSPEDATMQQLTDAGFVIPDQIQSVPSNAAQSKFYDQIAFRVREDRFGTTGKAGVFNYFETVYRDEDEKIYIPDMGQRYFTTSSGKTRDDKSKTRYYKTYWRTHQMSDHLPMWVELKIDYSDEYLERMKPQKK